jgi:hypothetical protein
MGVGKGGSTLDRAGGELDAHIPFVGKIWHMAIMHIGDIFAVCALQIERPM